MSEQAVCLGLLSCRTREQVHVAMVERPVPVCHQFDFEPGRLERGQGEIGDQVWHQPQSKHWTPPSTMLDQTGSLIPLKRAGSFDWGLSARWRSHRCPNSPESDYNCRSSETAVVGSALIRSSDARHGSSAGL